MSLTPNSSLLENKSIMKESAITAADDTGINERIARRVRDLRTVRGYTLDALAARSGVSLSLIHI